MNPIVKEQLNNCKVAIIPEFTDTTTKILIPCNTDSVGNDVLENHCYLIELEDYILHPSDGFNLHETWNRGIIPRSKYLKAIPTQFSGKMVKFDATGTNYDGDISNKDVYIGIWIPRKSFKIVREI